MGDSWDRDPQYWTKVKKLNRSFTSWVTQYMNISPDYDFSPVCNDYLKHMSSLQASFPVKHIKVTDKVKDRDTNFVTMSESPSKAIKTGFNASPSASSTPNGEALFPKGNGPMPVSVVKVVDLENEKQERQGEEDEDAPPLPPPPKIFEEDYLYSIRCKFFHKFEGSFKERGVGQLFVKKHEGKSQLVIRTDNANGTIMLNIRLTKTIPLSQNSNGVIIICHPNPPLVVKDQEITDPVTFFIKVKTKELAKDLLEQLKKYQD